MFIRILAIAALAALPAVARAAVDCTAREPLLPHVCASGANEGSTCQPDFTGADTLICSASRPAQNDTCGGAKCTMVFEKGANFSAEMLIIVDDNVSQMDGAQSINNAVAATVVFNLGKNGFFAQTYQTLGADLASLTQAPVDDFGVTLDEQRLRQEMLPHPNETKAAIVNDLLFRPQDTDLADALRALFVTTGTPVVFKVSSPVLSDHTDGLATVMRLKVKGGFILP
ncbi:MAG TPA: hypothetical protein VMS22_04460 [Candidatus Eisenbacteria bacterium]|nr:hypothetical protein [Candidatus Eisenbacteria bacterium]